MHLLLVRVALRSTAHLLARDARARADHARLARTLARVLAAALLRAHSLRLTRQLVLVHLREGRHRPMLLARTIRAQQHVQLLRRRARARHVRSTTQRFLLQLTSAAHSCRLLLAARAAIKFVVQVARVDLLRRREARPRANQRVVRASIRTSHHVLSLS